MTKLQAHARSLWASTTRGQRQTAALALAVSMAVVVAGSPRRVINETVERRRAPGALHAPLATTAAAQPVSLASAPPVAFAATPTVSLGDEEAVAPSATGPLRAPAPRIVALVQPAAPTPSNATVVPGRDDGSIAAVFLSRTGLTATRIAADAADPGLCDKVVAAGTVAVASLDVDPGVRACLVSRGVTLVAFDAAGDLPPADGGSGQVVSTRRGLLASLLDLGRWGVVDRTLSGRVGIAATRDAANLVSSAIPGLEATGIKIVAQAYVRTDANADADIAQAAVDFSGKGVDTVLFVLPVALQRRWAGQQSVLTPGVRYVVSDAYDGIVSESYLPTFDGALAHTSLRLPWYSRAHGTTDAQQACLAAWEAAATPAVTAPGDETERVLAWCENTALVAAALTASPEIGFAKALRSTRLPSPLTSDLGPVDDGGYGPLQDAVLTWRASCSCWSETRPFADRS